MSYYGPARQLTREMVLAAMGKIKAQPYREPHRHVVHPHARGWTSCADCFEWIHV